MENQEKLVFHFTLFTLFTPSPFHHFYTPKDTKTFLNLLSFGTRINTFIF